LTAGKRESLCGAFVSLGKKNEPLNHTKQHETQYHVEYLNVVSCDLVDQILAFFRPELKVVIKLDEIPVEVMVRSLPPLEDCGFF